MKVHIRVGSIEAFIILMLAVAATGVAFRCAVNAQQRTHCTESGGRVIYVHSASPTDAWICERP
jgi:hypothetical protein